MDRNPRNTLTVAGGCFSDGPAQRRTADKLLPARPTQIDAKRPARMSVMSRLALLIAANDSAFDSPTLRKKSAGGKLDGTYPKIRVTPSTPVTSSHPASPPSMILSCDPLMFLPTYSSGRGSRAMMLPSRSASNFDHVGGSPFPCR